MAGTGLFTHAQLAPVRAILDRSPTARAVMAEIDRYPTRVRVQPWPKDGVTLDKANRYGTTASYHPGANQVTLPASWLTKQGRDVQIRTKAGTASAHIPGELGPEAATEILHEARHRQQAGRFPRLSTYGGMLLGPDLVRGVVSGVRELRGAHADAGRGALRRFADGFDRSSMRNELDAYTIQSKVARELGIDTSTDTFPDDPDAAFAYLHDFPEYRRQTVLHRIVSTVMPITLAEGIREQIAAPTDQ